MGDRENCESFLADLLSLRRQLEAELPKLKEDRSGEVAVSLLKSVIKYFEDPGRTWLIRVAAEDGDLGPLKKKLREKLSPEFAELAEIAVNAIEGKYRKAAHRPSKVARDLEIYRFLGPRLDEGVSPKKAKASAVEKFRVSKDIVQKVYEKHLLRKK